MTKKLDPAAKARRLELARKALDLRISGLTVVQIGEHLGISTSLASKILAQAMEHAQKRFQESAEQLTQIQLQRLEKLYRAIEPAALKSGHSGQPRAAEVAMKLLERQAKLLGLDAPVKQEIRVELMDMTDHELRDEAERMRLALAHSTPVPSLLPGEKPDTIPSVLIDSLQKQLTYRGHRSTPDDGEPERADHSDPEGPEVR